MYFRPEPPIRAAAGKPAPAPRTGVLLVNLGTPDTPTPAATRRFLAEFLSDPRVVELPRALWLPILYGAVLTTRPAKSAAKYKTVWMPEGSPLLVWSQRQAVRLRGALGQRGQPATVLAAMRYGQPGIAAQLDELKKQGCTRVLVLPMYPQYSASTTASVMDAIGAWMRRTRVLPEMRLVQSYATDAHYIQALTRRAREYWQTNGQPGHVVMSFHGLPERMVRLGDPYQAECRASAQSLAQRLGLRDGQWTLAFQSRFGRGKWIGPATDEVLHQLGRARTSRVDIMCPGFVADCLETLEEIAQEGKETFQHAGGGEYHYIPCLNDHPQWISALAELAQTHLQGWPPAPADSPPAATPAPGAIWRGWG